MVIDHFGPFRFTIYQFICINNKNLKDLKDFFKNPRNLCQNIINPKIIILTEPSVSQAEHAEKLFTEQKEQGNPRTAQKLQRQMKSKPDQAAEPASE